MIKAVADVFFGSNAHENIKSNAKAFKEKQYEKII